jgi:hypothetical protein
MVEYKPPFCRICEPLCGMIATVEDGRLPALRPDADHPLRRRDGAFEPVCWVEALAGMSWLTGVPVQVQA